MSSHDVSEFAKLVETKVNVYLDPDRRRLAKLAISLDLMLELWKGGTHLYKITAHALPEDVKLVRERYDWSNGQFELLLWSMEFEPIIEGGQIPWLVPGPQCEHLRGEVVAVDRLPCQSGPGSN
jgi:hypothetical protein